MVIIGKALRVGVVGGVGVQRHGQLPRAHAGQARGGALGVLRLRLLCHQLREHVGQLVIAARRQIILDGCPVHAHPGGERLGHQVFHVRPGHGGQLLPHAAREEVLRMLWMVR